MLTTQKKTSKISTKSPAPEWNAIKQEFSPSKKYEKINELKRKYGNEAELFVINYEKKRVGSTKAPFVKKVSSIKGYDIQSYNSKDSNRIDRFIEVKSYGKNMTFYLTHTEINTAINFGENYYIYLVDRTKMKDSLYEPTIVQNPYLEIIMGKYENRQIDKIKVAWG